MGATVTVDKRAYAFRSGEKVFYVLFESTYEKNCYPHQSHWSCIAIGDLRQVLSRIYRSVHSMISGDLQGKNGWISPVNYLKGWMAELSNPWAMPDKTITLKYGTGFYDALQSKEDPGWAKSIDQIRAVMADSGVNTEPLDRAIAAGKNGHAMTLALHENGQFFADLVANGVFPWRLIDSLPAINRVTGDDVVSLERDASLGCPMGPKVSYKLNHRYVRVVTHGQYSDHAVLIRQDLKTRTWDIDCYDRSWLCSLAVEEELARPGSVVSGLSVHLKAQKEALYAGLDTKLTIDRPDGDDNRWFRENYIAFTQKLGCPPVTDTWAIESVTTTIQACAENDALQDLGNQLTKAAFSEGRIREIEICDASLVDDAAMYLTLLGFRKAA